MIALASSPPGRALRDDMSRASLELEQRVLSRFIPSLTRVLAVATFTHVYTGSLSPTSTFTWGDCWGKGTLFLVETSSPTTPFYLIQLNRLEKRTFLHALTDDALVEFDPEGKMQLMVMEGERAHGLVFNAADGEFGAEYGREIREMGEKAKECARVAAERRRAAEEGVGEDPSARLRRMVLR